MDSLIHCPTALYCPGTALLRKGTPGKGHCPTALPLYIGEGIGQRFLTLRGIGLLPCPQSYFLAIPRHQLRTLAAVIILTARRLTGSNGTNPSLAVQTLSGIAENYPQSATGTLSPVSYRHP